MFKAKVLLSSMALLAACASKSGGSDGAATADAPSDALVIADHASPPDAAVDGPRDAPPAPPDGSPQDLPVDGPPADLAPATDLFAQTDAPAGCGNGTREGQEQCDDGNNINLDGCDSHCRYEQTQRINYLQLQYGLDAFCTANAFGGAVTDSLVQSLLQQQIDSGISDGSISVLFKFFDLDDLSGVNDSALTIGVFGGAPVAVAGYSGNADLDWWYNASPATIDVNRNPLAILDGAISGGTLTAGPGALPLTLNLVGVTAKLALTNVKLTVDNAAATKPTIASANLPPGHRAAENLDPALVSWPASGQHNATGSGKLCGSITAKSLANVAVPGLLSGVCDEGYSPSTNSMLDIVVGGCTAALVGQALKPTQPDSDDPDVPPVGAGPPYKLIADTTGVVTSCTDKSGATVALSDCLADAAFSAWFRFASGRVIPR